VSENLSYILVICGVGLLLGAALHDLAIRTIPNWISVSLLVIGIVLRFYSGDLLFSLAIAMAILTVLVLLWLRGFLGGGDVKLIPTVSLVLAPANVPAFILSVAIAGGVLSVFYLTAHYAMPRPRPGPRYGLLARVLKAEAWRMHRRGPLPYGVAIAAGALPIIAKSFSGWIG
jgi:prepilin peptidase CpaA